MYCKQRIVQLYYERKVSCGNIARVLAAEGYRVPKQTVWATTKKYKDHGTLSRLPGSGRRFKLTPEVLAMIEERMRTDDKTTATQLVKMVNAAGYNVSKSTIIRARRILGWTFHGSRYCQMIRTQNKEKRRQWAHENLHNRFENIVWTDESMIQLENHRMFSYRKVGEAPRPKATKVSTQNHGVGRDLQERSNKHLPPELFRQQLCVPGGTPDAPLAFSSCKSTRWSTAAG